MQCRVTALLGVAIVAAAVLSPVRAHAQDVNSAPNPYRAVEDWAKLPEGRAWGQAIGIDIDRDGKSVWVFDRCGAKTCTGSNVAPIQKFDASGKLVASFGAGMFNFPHGLFVDRDGNVWVSDGKSADGKGHTVIKFSPDGKVLMTLGTPGVAGNDEHHFNAPSDVAVAANGDIFVADGHGGDSNARIVKFSKDGKFITAWGHKGSATGEFDTPHGLALDSAGRLYVADRSNDRVQIFDPRRQVHRRMEAVRPAERRLHRQARHDLCRRLAIGREVQQIVQARYPHRQRHGRQGCRLYRQRRNHRVAGRRRRR